MILSIITINRNNSIGLEKTMQSVFSQARTDFEYVVIDGASTDSSIEVIERYAKRFGDRLKWISEPDKGIYDAMNKGIGMATGEYFQFLNSGDCLVTDDVIEKVYEVLDAKGHPAILYGNLLKDIKGRVIQDRCFSGQEITFLGFYLGSLNHSSSFIRKDLFGKYGLYDDSLKIVSDWKWFLQAIILGGEQPIYTDIDITLFDMNGISETNKELNKQEREQVLTQLMPSAILKDYEKWAHSIMQMKRLKRHPLAYKLVWFLERCLFKIEKYQK